MLQFCASSWLGRWVLTLSKQGVIRTDLLLNVGGEVRRRLLSISFQGQYLYTLSSDLSPEINFGSGLGPPPTALSRGKKIARV